MVPIDDYQLSILVSISPPVAFPEVSTMGAAAASAASETKTYEYLIFAELKVETSSFD